MYENIIMDDGEKYSLLEGDKLPPSSTNNEEQNASSSFTQCRVYKRRWYVLFVFTLTSIVSNVMWNTWGPIQRPCRFVCGWERWEIVFLSSLGAIGPILGAFPSTWLMDTKGLRTSVMVTSSMLFAGKVIQVIPFSNITLRTVVIFLGHLIAMLPSFIVNGGSPLLSNTWFPPNERTTATAIGALAGYVGNALAFFVGPSMIPFDSVSDSFNNSERNLSDQYAHLIETRIMDYFYLQIGFAAFLFLCVIVYFPSKPPLHPSMAALNKKTTEIKYKDGLWMLLHNQSYWLLVFVFAASCGIYAGWTSVLDLAVQSFNISETTSGWLGTCACLAGVISGIIVARSADIVKRWTKVIILVLFVGTAVTLLIFTLTCSRILPFSQGLLFTSIIGSGLFFNGTMPLMFELIMECVFPVGEGTSVGIVLILGNAVILLFDVTFMFPITDVRWMNWVCVGGITVCVPLLLLHKTQYRRLNLDTKS